MIRLSDFTPRWALPKLRSPFGRGRPGLLPPAAAGEPWLMTVIAVLCFLACLAAVAASAADRAARMAEELESIRERAAVMHDALTDLRAEQIDQRSLTIAVVAMVFLPLTFITGLLGMNVEGIPDAKDPKAFWEVIGLCLLIAVGITVYFRRHQWLGSGSSKPD